jgi:threonine/homoserine/homoserine lactone efflux protein
MISLFFISLLGSMIPGASFVITVRNSLFGSRFCGIMTALGLSCGMALHAAYLLPSLYWFKYNGSIFIDIVRILGAIYLFIFGIFCLKAKKKKTSKESIAKVKNKITPSKSFIMGFITDALNPKIIIFILALLSQYIEDNSGIKSYLYYGFILVLVQIFWFGSVAMLFSSKKLRNKIYGVSHWIERVSGITLILLSLKLLFIYTPST